MAAGNTYKQCGCRDEDGTRLGQQCPKLRRGNGTWRPGTAGGTTSSNSRRAPTAPAAPRCAAAGSTPRPTPSRNCARPANCSPSPPPVTPRPPSGSPMPSPSLSGRPGSCPTPAGSAKRSAAATIPPSGRPPSVNGWRNGWPPRRTCGPGTARGYASHIRLYYQPHIGYISIDRLRVTDVASVFEAIDELNEAITAARTSGDPARRAEAKGRRLVGAATQQRIRATLRSAISTYMKQHQGMLPANVASLVELPAGDRPKPLVWTDERVQAWQKDFEARLTGARERAHGGRVSPLDIWISTPRPSPVMVWTPAQTQVFLASCRPAPPVRAVAADRLPRAAPRRRLRAAPHRHRPARRRHHDPVADHPARLGHRPGRPQIRRRGAAGRPRRRHRRRHPRPPPRQQERKGSSRGRLGRLRVRVHQPRRQPAAPRRRHRHVRAARLPRRAAAHPAARPAPRRRHPRANERSCIRCIIRRFA